MQLAHLALILLTVCVTAAGQVLLKVAMADGTLAGRLKVSAGDFLLGAITSLPLLAGAIAYCLGFCLWLAVLNKVPLSLAYPFVGLAFPLTMALAALFLGESLDAWRIAGTLVIFVGCVLVAKSG